VRGAVLNWLPLLDKARTLFYLPDDELRTRGKRVDEVVEGLECGAKPRS
jgi:hypothetical protein